LQPGGAEIFARDLFQQMRRQGDFDAWLVARATGVEPHRGTRFSGIDGSSREILLHFDQFDHFLQSQPSTDVIATHFRELLELIRPDVVHFQHTIHMGMELLREVRNTLPGVPIVYTLHEYIPICFAQGQMVRTRTHALCHRATPQRCHDCFPEISPALFKTRELFLKAHLDLVDAFLCPSRFLLGRYAEWGLDPSKLHHFPNGRTIQAEAPPRNLDAAGKRNRFAFFGQINSYKGVLPLLEAMRILVEQGTDARLDIYGANLEMQPAEFQQAFGDGLRAAGPRARVHPAYRQHDLPALMQTVDWVVVPSIWWENAPLVIQEAFMHRRPVITAGIGGLAEAVGHDRNGLHFVAGDAADLADRMREAAEIPGLWERLRNGIEPVFPIAAAATAHADLYRELLERRPS
jgi:glycosyltransferase involved in cell wall biosynthesis